MCPWAYTARAGMRAHVWLGVLASWALVVATLNLPGRHPTPGAGTSAKQVRRNNVTKASRFPWKPAAPREYVLPHSPTQRSYAESISPGKQGFPCHKTEVHPITSQDQR